MTTLADYYRHFRPGLPALRAYLAARCCLALARLGGVAGPEVGWVGAHARGLSERQLRQALAVRRGQN